ncbi:MAG: hypothetical protein DRJ64_09425 [Thermoprotei archaeon]|nr:MAG: hypothetical protein DRJ64_09425 [Thermoprotei archaeon]
MLFKITKYITRGEHKGDEIVSYLNFSSQEVADVWADKASSDLKNPFVVIEVMPTSKFNKVHNSY